MKDLFDVIISTNHIITYMYYMHIPFEGPEKKEYNGPLRRGTNVKDSFEVNYPDGCPICIFLRVCFKFQLYLYISTYML